MLFRSLFGVSKYNFIDHEICNSRNRMGYYTMRPTFDQYIVANCLYTIDEFNILYRGWDKPDLKIEADEKFNEIVEFSELHDFLDVPVRNFSSGMIARLAFSVATIVDPEILIVDEILSVGDIAFQAKSEAKMLNMIKGGTTVLYVSHSLESIKKLCDRVIWLEHGVVQKIGGKEICDEYFKFMEGK